MDVHVFPGASFVVMLVCVLYNPPFANSISTAPSSNLSASVAAQAQAPRVAFADESASASEGAIALDEAIEMLSSTLGLPEGQALVLLSAFDWDRKACAEAFLADPKSTRRMVGPHSIGASVFKPAAKSSASSVKECSVCFGETENPELVCGHLFCSVCLSMQIEVKLKDKPRGCVECPGFKCKQVISEEALRTLGVRNELLRQWRHELGRVFLEAASESSTGMRVVHCKSARCSAVLRVSQSSNGACRCSECSHAFCFRCDFPSPHAPATCDMMAKWQEKGGMVEASKEDMANWLEIRKVSKQCPRCRHAIIKEPETCNHMTCRPDASGCGHHFCYLCLADWDESTYKCTNSTCPSSGSGGGNIYATESTGSTDEFQNMNEECAKHIAALRKVQTTYEQTLRTAPGSASSGAGRAHGARCAAALALVDTFRFLANAAITTSHLPKDSALRARLSEIRASLQTHAASAQAKLGSEWTVAALGSEALRSGLFSSIAAMQKETERCESEIGPLILAHKDKPTHSFGTPGPAEDELQVPCELCAVPVLIKDFAKHLHTMHGVELGRDSPGTDAAQEAMGDLKGFGAGGREELKM